MESNGYGGNMEAKELLYSIGIGVTFIIGLLNIINNLKTHKKTTFINSVTSERVKWISKLRESISDYCGLTLHWALTDISDQQEENELLKKVDVLRYNIRLQLNPDGDIDKEITELVDRIPDLTGDEKVEELENAVKKLTEKTQILLKKEWEKVKEEAKKGDLKKSS